jgi:hypothetical protein
LVTQNERRQSVSAGTLGKNDIGGLGPQSGLERIKRLSLAVIDDAAGARNPENKRVGDGL